MRTIALAILVLCSCDNLVAYCNAHGNGTPEECAAWGPQEK